MSGTPKQICQLRVLDRLAVLTDLDHDLQAVITRLAQRARTDDEGDDVRLLIDCRIGIARYRALVAQCHKDCRIGSDT